MGGKKGKKGKGSTQDEEPKQAASNAKNDLAARIAAKLGLDAAPRVSGAHLNFAKTKFLPGVRDIVVEGLDVQFFGHEILTNQKIELYQGHRYGLIGPNGCGKSTLLNCFGCGEIPIPDIVDYFQLAHEVGSSDKSAIETVLEVDIEKDMLDAEMEELMAMDEMEDWAAERMSEIQTRLDEMEADTAEMRAASILSGLGFNDDMMKAPCSSFSGGWRMRIALAQALYLNPTLLLLDEPTNHLDIEAVVWLEKYLQKYNKILLMVSHSQDFMNSVCTNIIHMRGGQLKYYGGNYDSYCDERANAEENQMKQYVKQQGDVSRLKDFIARFGHGTKKLARQAQSREKVLAKMEAGGMIQEVVRDRNISFYFPCGGDLPPPIIEFQEVNFGYPGKPLLYNKLDLFLDMDSRICLVGPNGAGKTTLQKLICSELEVSGGVVKRNAHCVMARFNQHFVDQLDIEKSPLAYMMEYFQLDSTQTNVQQIRSYLGRFGISGPQQSQPIGQLSDGQKARVVMAWIARKQPHLILLDEPTNHLDMESIDALGEALCEFEGAVVVVSHDMRLIAQIAEEIWICDEGTVRKFPGDISEYKQVVQRTVDAAMAKDGMTKKEQTQVGSSQTGARAAAAGAGNTFGGPPARAAWGVLDLKSSK